MPSRKAASITGHVNINTCAQLRQRVAVAPVAVAIDANTIQSYRRGVFTSTTCNPYGLNHGMVVVGYGTDATLKKDFWIVRNSWSSLWGESGYIRMDRGGVHATLGTGICGICSMASYPTV